MLSRELRTGNKGGKGIMSMNEMMILSGALAVFIVIIVKQTI